MTLHLTNASIDSTWRDVDVVITVTQVLALTICLYSIYYFCLQTSHMFIFQFNLWQMLFWNHFGTMYLILCSQLSSIQLTYNMTCPSKKNIIKIHISWSVSFYRNVKEVFDIRFSSYLYQRIWHRWYRNLSKYIISVK